jgi:hypothetical protein
MRISSTEELKAFLIENFNDLTDEAYTELISETIGVYEHSKPADVKTLINKIDTHWNHLQSYKQNQELPLFFIVDADKIPS